MYIHATCKNQHSVGFAFAATAAAIVAADKSQQIWPYKYLCLYVYVYLYIYINMLANLHTTHRDSDANNLSGDDTQTCSFLQRPTK